MSILYVQRQGKVSGKEWLFASSICALSALILIGTSEYKKLAGLVATLRIKEAQRVLTEHPEWSVESVVDYCGFNDRKYFHQVFQQYTGTTPAKYQQKN